MTRRAAASTALALLAAAAFSGCGTAGFNRAWKNPPPLTTAASVDPLAGRWEGSWLSGKNGHRGRLRSILTPRPEGGSLRYRAQFHATYWKVFRFAYATELAAAAPAQGDLGLTHFRGENDLGCLAGGVYHYEGFAAPGYFFATYRSTHDFGTFELRRPGE